MEEKARTFHCNKIIKWSYRLQVVEWHESIDLNEGWMEYSMMVKTPICDLCQSFNSGIKILPNPKSPRLAKLFKRS